jgi:hypothetical protein
MNPFQKMSREDVLTDFAAVEGPVTDERLAAFVGRHPELAEELAELASELKQMEETPWPHVVVDQGSGAKALGLFAEIEASLVKERHRPSVNPFESLKPPDFRRIATALGANTLFVLRLKDRLIRIEDFTAGLLNEIARAVGTSVELMREHLSGEPHLAAGRMFKADTKPGPVERQSLQQALDDSGLSEDQKRRLLSL